MLTLKERTISANGQFIIIANIDMKIGFFVARVCFMLNFDNNEIRMVDRSQQIVLRSKSNHQLFTNRKKTMN